ncbi:hypothetical protein HaLaN_06321 [Haematococcus lacustris]|uniref:Uncharacterized protein n=1 Tax=Haematococcus lacustris TaxID=44745 RepID=A0A699YV77_HAELA|nr:hypothetical protein HaLaN_06321 [Haematococcus lacustris]
MVEAEEFRLKQRLAHYRHHANLQQQGQAESFR